MTAVFSGDCASNLVLGRSCYAKPSRISCSVLPDSAHGSRDINPHITVVDFSVSTEILSIMGISFSSSTRLQNLAELWITLRYGI